jgi:hypothetical protein
MSLVFAAMVVASMATNFVLLAAIAAGRLNKGWGQRVLLGVEITFLAVATVAVVGAAWPWRIPWAGRLHAATFELVWWAHWHLVLRLCSVGC